MFTHTQHRRADDPPRGLATSPQVESASVTKSYRFRSTLAVAIAAAIPVALVQLPAAHAQGGPPPPTAVTLKIVERTSGQDQGAWVVDYRLKNVGPASVTIAPDQIKAKVEGWVSNSRVASHALPRWSSLVVAHGPDLSTVNDVISASDEATRCREKLIVTLRAEEPRQVSAKPNTPAKTSVAAEPDAKVVADAWANQPGAPKLDPKVSPAAPAIDSTSAKPNTANATNSEGKPLALAPGQMVRLRLRIEHLHMIYGDYDPLLASRSVELTLGGATLRDVVPLNREQYVAQPRFQWPEPPEERRDNRHSISPPDSLHLEAHVPGHHYYRFPERPVRYSTKMRLRFWYLVAAGTEGECKAKIAQYKDTPTTWKRLNDGGFEQCLKTVGRWTLVERVFMTESEATTVALEFNIVGETDIGEMWIDNVSLEPVDGMTPGGP